jgi:hypothetical protein
MGRIFALGWFLWSTAGLIVLSGWDIYCAVTVRQDRWMFALVPIYVLLAWSFFQASRVTHRKTNSN